jgi:hypothetical protein
MKKHTQWSYTSERMEDLQYKRQSITSGIRFVQQFIQRPIVVAQAPIHGQEIFSTGATGLLPCSCVFDAPRLLVH